ncbi:MAG: outer membrane beta-barrel protein [Cyclobacteriaceae bacterium]|nr:outer membrane beta-barrel protein [Cyclobacteriaceae bacterium]
MMRKTILVVVLVAIAESIVAQSFYAIRKNRSLIGVVGTGTSTYFGELSNPGDYFNPDLNLNLGLQYYLTPRFSARTEITWFKTSGDDAKADHGGRVKRNLSFKSNNIEVNAVGMINLTPNGNRYYRRPQLNAYAFGGIALLYFNPTAELNGSTYALQPLKTEGIAYSRFAFALPFGFGVRKKIGPNSNLAFEWGYRKTFSDYLDDVSTAYPDLSGYTGPALALSFRGQEKGLDQPFPVEGQKRGNPETDDGYMLLSLKFEYYLPFDLNDQGNGRMYSRKRSASYRYNKRGGLRR